MKIIDKVKKNRGAGLVIVLMVYILATLIGVDVYRSLTFDWWLNLLIADVVATFVTFIFSIVFSNASVYDPYWSVQPIVIILGFAISEEITLVGTLLLIAVCFWGMRLTLNWCYTFHSFQYQDWRYIMLREKSGVFYPLVNLFGIHLVPTLIVYMCIAPAAYAIINEAQINIGSILFFCVSIGAIILQGTADMQMHRFRKQKTDYFINKGLWKYSRHPNYLGEIIMWWSVALSVVSAFPGEWYLCTGAIANNLLFLFVSIPMADKRQAEKPGFNDYKKRTRMLLPIMK